MFFEAQLITQELKKGNDNLDKQGHVYLYPESTLGKKELTAYETLNYIKYDSQDPNDNNTFKKKLAANATDIQNYFSVNNEGKLVLASLETTNVKKVTKTEGNLFDKTENNTSYVATEIVIDYKNLISQYSTPMTFFLELGMVTRNPNFLEAVVNMVKENTNIQLTVLNTTTEEITTQIDKYTEHTISREAYWGPDNGFVKPEITEEEKEVNVTETTTTTITTKIPTVKVTSVNTWICEQNINYSKLPDEKTSVDSTIEQQSEKEKTLSDDTSDLEDKALEEGVPVKESVSWITREPTTVNITTTIQNYDSGIPSDYKYKAGEKPDEDPNYASFVDLLDVLYKIPNSKERRTAGAYLKTDTDMFFNLLQQHPETQGMEQIMRYIMYKYTGKNYGVTELDFSIFDVNYFTPVSGGGLLKEYIRSFEGNHGMNEDGSKYVIASGKTVGYGVDLDDSGYEIVFINAGYSTNIGDYVDVEFVDSIEDEIRNNYINTIKSKTSGLNLKEYQIHALVSRAYNCGTSGALDKNYTSVSNMNFNEAYNAYWKEEKDDKFEEKNNQADFNHQLYTNFMSKPTKGKDANGNSVEMPGLATRRKSEWTLFQTGYYDTLEKWYQSFADYGVEVVTAAGYSFPHYLQGNYQESYGSSTIARAGCGPTSLAMIIAGLKNDPSITPVTMVQNINEYWPNEQYYVKGVGSSHIIFSNSFLQKYYGVSSEPVTSTTQAYKALENGYPIIGGEQGHFLVILPLPEEYKNSNYKFYVLDSARGHSGAYRSPEEFVNKWGSKASYLRFSYIIKPY